MPLVSEGAQSGNFSYTQSSGEVTITKYSGAEGLLVVPSTLDGMPVTQIGDSAFAGNTSITNLILPEATRVIQREGLARCWALASVEIPEGVNLIGADAFLFCTNLTEIAIPRSVTNIEGIPFYLCTGLTNISVASGNPVYSSSLGALYNTNRTTLLRCPGGKTAFVIPNDVTEIGNNAFAGCTELSSIVVPETITAIDDEAFFNCPNLSAVYFRGNKPSDGGYLFESSTSAGVYRRSTATNWTASFGERSVALWPETPSSEFKWATNETGLTVTSYIGTNQVVTIPSTVGGKPVTRIGVEAFMELHDLAEIAIPETVTVIDWEAFSQCTGLVNLTIPEGVTLVLDDAFVHCTGLDRVSIPSTLTNFSNIPFYLCDQLRKLEVSPANPLFSSIDGALYNKQKTSFLRCPSGKTDTFFVTPGVTNIEVGAFLGSTHLTSIVVPASVTAVADAAFEYCPSLQAVYFEGDPPAFGQAVFESSIAATVYHKPTTATWPTTLGNQPTAAWPELTLQSQGLSRTLTWPSGVLQSTTNPTTGPWTAVPSAKSPYTVTNEVPQNYFRLKLD